MKHILSVVVLAFALILSACGPGAPKSAAEGAFDAANNEIIASSDTVAFGNTPEAVKLAEKFSSTMGVLQKEMFKGGGKIHGLTGGKFLTYCQISNEHLIFLCHVPGLKDYKGEVRDALSELAWTVAQKIGQTSSGSKTMVVALRGAVVYGPVWSGKAGAAPEKKATGRNALEPFYPAFETGSKPPAAVAP